MAKKLTLRPNRWQIKPLKLLPHEWAFNAFVLLTLLRLLIAGEFVALPTVSFLAFLLVAVSLIIWTQDKPTPLRWRLRLLWYPCVMGLAFYIIPEAVRLLEVTSADTRLAALDESILGLPAADYFMFVQSPMLTDIMCLGYVFFFIYLIVGPGYYCIYDLRRFRECFVGMFTIYAIGFLGYTLLPAGGPYQALEFLEPLPEGPVAQQVLRFINQASNGVDVFPSIHVAISLYLLLFDRWNYRARYELMLLPCLLLWLSTVYLRYHYAVDLVAGAALSLIGLGIVWLYRRTKFAQTLEEEALVARLRG